MIRKKSTHHISIVVLAHVDVEPDLSLVEQSHDLILIPDGSLLDQTPSNVEPDPVGQLEGGRIIVRMVESLVRRSENREGSFVTDNL
jgi:hypothetical protein